MLVSFACVNYNKPLDVLMVNSILLIVLPLYYCRVL